MCVFTHTPDDDNSEMTDCAWFIEMSSVNEMKAALKEQADVESRRVAVLNRWEQFKSSAGTFWGTGHRSPRILHELAVVPPAQRRSQLENALRLQQVYTNKSHLVNKNQSTDCFIAGVVL